ncbi:hypothetical protein V8F20_005703 [Naviculisporaceae sp. PSN 640]
MDVVSSAAAVLQLLAQAVTLVQQVYSMREAVKAAPKQLSDTQDQLSNLIETIEYVWNEPELHTPTIQTQMIVIRDISEELTHILGLMKALQERGKVYQGLYMLVKKTRDEGRLSDVLGRLARAKAELAIRIDVVHVGLTRGVRMGVERIEQGMMARSGNEKESWRNDEMKKKRKKKKPEREEGIEDSRLFRHELRVDLNVVEDDGTQMNGIVGFGENKTVTPSKASVVKNRASGRGQQRNFIFGSGGVDELRACGF